MAKKEKFEIVRLWGGLAATVQVGDIVELDTEKMHPALLANVRPVRGKVQADVGEAKAEAAKIVAEAKAEAAELLKTATAEAEKIIAEAHATPPVAKK